MDFVLEVDMETGDVSELLDLRNIFPDYYDKTEKVSDTDPSSGRREPGTGFI